MHDIVNYVFNSLRTVESFVLGDVYLTEFRWLFFIIIYIGVYGVLAASCLVLLTYIWKCYYNNQKDSTCNKPLPPGVMGYPLIGESLQFASQGANFFYNKFSEYGDMYKTHVIGRPTIRLSGCNKIKDILTGEGVLVQVMWPKSVQLLLGKGSLSNSHGDVLRKKKSCVLKVLNAETISYMVPEFQKVISSGINGWIDEGHIYGHKKVIQLTYELAGHMILGLDLLNGHSEELLENFRTMIRNMFCAPVNCPGFSLHKATAARRKISEGIKELLVKSEKNKNKITNPVCVLDSLQNLQEPLSDETMADMLTEILFGGHHTTATAFTFILLYLGRDQKIPEKLRQELKENDLLSADTPLNYDHITKLVYLDHVCKEVLRIQPPVGGAFRKVLKTFEAGDYQVPKDWTVIYGIRETHYSSPLFVNPEIFNPDRWQHVQVNHPDFRFHYLPFGVSSRSCPGEAFAKLTLKIFIIELTRRCEWKLENTDPKIVFTPSPSPADNLPMTITKLNY